MSTQHTSDERVDGGTDTTNPEETKSNELLAYLLTGRVQFVTIFVGVEVVIMLWAVLWEYVIGNSVVAALAAASALLFLIIAGVFLACWGGVKVIQSIR